MDLCEARCGRTRRHPWEVARIHALKRILRAVSLTAEVDVLDVGCGDGFAAKELFSERKIGSLTGLDVAFTEEQLRALNDAEERVAYVRRFSDLAERRFDLVLLLDVIEHVADDASFLATVVRDLLAQDGVVLITVPAFDILFSKHDRYLKHYRRYSLDQLCGVTEDVGLKTLSRGYLFGSLLGPRALTCCLERMHSKSRTESCKGVGEWRGGRLTSQIIEQVLNIDNRILLALRRIGVTLPGLTAWNLCKRR